MIKDLEMGRLFWTTQGDLVGAQGSLQGKEGSRSQCQNDAMKDSSPAGFEDEKGP